MLRFYIVHELGIIYGLCPLLLSKKWAQLVLEIGGNWSSAFVLYALFVLHTSFVFCLLPKQ